MTLLRLLVIGLLVVCGAFFLAMGLEVPLPNVGWHAAPGRDIAIGIVLVFAGIAIARFWTVPEDESKLVEDWKKSRKHLK